MFTVNFRFSMYMFLSMLVVANVIMMMIALFNLLTRHKKKLTRGTMIFVFCIITAAACAAAYLLATLFSSIGLIL